MVRDARHRPQRQRDQEASTVVCKGVTMTNDGAHEEELDVVIRALREEVERLKAEVARLRNDRDERPPHYL